MNKTIVGVRTKRYGLSLKATKYMQCYVMIALPIIGFVVFIIYPYIWTAVKSWFYYTGNPAVTRFVGWNNFKDVAGDGVYWNSWLTSFKLTLYKLPIELPISLVLALILNNLKGAGFFRTAFFLPSIISVAILGIIVTNMFDYFGFVNAWLIKAGLITKEIDWFSSTFNAMTALTVGSIWNSFGTNVIYFTAALSNIPEELYEAAYIDGAGKMRTFFKITLPLMSPVLQTIILLAVNGTRQCNDYILVTTAGAPGGTTNTVMAHITNSFLLGFAKGDVNIGYGCAMSLVTSALMCCFAGLYMKLSQKMSNIY